MQTRSKQALGTIIFIAGLFISLGLAVVAIWGDFEAMSYFYNGAGYRSFSGLNCPVLMSRGEVETVSATFDNGSNEVIQPYYRVEISGTSASRRLEDQVPVAAHSSKRVQWTVSASDVDLGLFVMVKMDVLPIAGYSTRESTCGIVVLNMGGLSGGQVLSGGIGLSLIGIVLGLGLRETARRSTGGKDLSVRNALRAAGVASLLGLLTGLMGWWLIGVLFSAMTVLLLVILLRMTVT